MMMKDSNNWFSTSRYVPQRKVHQMRPGMDLSNQPQQHQRCAIQPAGQQSSGYLTNITLTSLTSGLSIRLAGFSALLATSSSSSKRGPLTQLDSVLDKLRDNDTVLCLTSSILSGLVATATPDVSDLELAGRVESSVSCAGR
jgi:hypothetical protein